MKIVHILPGLGMGGAERQLATLILNQSMVSPLKHCVISLSDEGHLGKSFMDAGIPVYAVHFRKSYIKGFWALFKILRKEKPDVLQSWLHYGDLIGTIIGTVVRVPRIIWNIRCSDIQPLFQQSKRNRYVVTLLSYLSFLPYAVITNSHAGRLAHEALRYTPKQWVHIPNGINTDFFSPNSHTRKSMRNALGISEDALVVGMIARVDPMKDHETFLKVMERLSKDFENVYCVIAGKGTDTAEFPTTPPNLKRLGLVDNIPDVLNSLDVHILSSFGEGFPNAVGESMACEIPTVATNVGDSAILLDDPSLVFDNADQLYEKLKHLLMLSYPERQTLGKQHRQRILHHYSVQTM
ncbi:MAG: glycosyltransferase, partial [Alphaproteobacteria bacterium]|nr:glycosyltransferase [Alphaproteobacteria bacterium]